MVNLAFNLSDLDGRNGFALNGINPGDGSGFSVSGAGDVNGDGFDDLIVGATGADPNGGGSGQSYVVFGSNGGFPGSLELADLDGGNGFALNGINPVDQSGRSVSGAGDVNGDGIDDLIIGADGADGRAGQSYMVFGSDGEFSASFELASLNGSNGFALNGINPVDRSGVSVSGAGDVNGDGFADLIIGAPSRYSGNDSYGQSYVVFGSDEGFPANLELADLNGTNGFTLNGINPGDFSGYSVSGAGDINGDGIDDLIVGALGAEPNGNGSGQSYVVFGSDEGFPASLELANLNGTNGLALNGINPGDFSGVSVSGAGDVNGDGFDDLIVGADFADPNGIDGAGQSYVVFGSDGGFPASLDLADLDGSNGFALNGINFGDESGNSVSGAGDFNGDGFDDLIVGAPYADPNGERSGQSYVVFGSDGRFPASLELANLDVTNGFILNGINEDDRSGRSVSGAGDINGDGIDDLIIGAWGADPNDRSSGQSYVVFGGAFQLTVVDTLVDEDDGNVTSGDVSLREAIRFINSGGIIDFDASLASADVGFGQGTIGLELGELVIDKSLIINGLGADVLTVSGNNNSRVFNVDDGTSDQIEVFIDGLTIANGFADADFPDGRRGGGIFNRENLTVTNSNISDNRATGGGGFANFGVAEVSNSIISGNTGTSDIGGIRNGQDSSVEGVTVEGILEVKNSTISGNIGADVGGGIGNRFGNVKVINSTVTGNTAGSDGGGIIHEKGVFEIINSIIAGNNGSTPDLEGTFTSNGFNLIGDPTGSSGFEDDKTFASEGIGDISEVLDPTLADNGGPTLTHALVPDSVAIDMGNNDDLPPDTEFDQRGPDFKRVVNGRLVKSTVDIGAFEVQEVTNSVFNLSDLDGTNGFALNGINEGDLSGSSVSGAGDVNGDGFDDLIVGAGPFPMSQSIGQSYVVFGSDEEFPDSLDLADLDGRNGFALNGINFGDGSGHSVSGAGDVNGDSFDDLIIGAYGADPNGDSSGQSYVVFGSDGGFPASFELADLDGTNGFALNGINPMDFSGFSVSGARDVNSDGFDDLIIGAGSFNQCIGQSYVVFGSGEELPDSIDLADLNGSNGFALDGINQDDNSGISVSGAGDVNGDGFDDLIVGAFNADTNADPNGERSGQSYVVFGSDGGFPASFELADLDGSNGFALNGINASDSSGESVSGAGDINGDGIDDLIVGAPGADPNGMEVAGRSYVVFGSNGVFPASLELSDLDGNNGFTLNGINERDQLGGSVSGAGDVNGDGIDDLIIGAGGADPNGEGSGQSYLVFGSNGVFPASLELANLDGTNGFALNGINEFDGSGTSVSGAGDINGDGIDDLIVGASSAEANGLRTGQSYVVFGVPDLEIGLYDTDSDTLITPIKSDDVIPASILPNGNVTIAAFVPENSRFFGDIESILLDLNQGDVTRTENVEPYALFGDFPPGDFKAGSGIPLGDNSISFKLYSGDGLSGDFLGTVTRSFSIVEDPHIGPSAFNLSDLDGTNGFALNGINEFDGSGSSVSGAGDVNGDGFDDLIVGASGADPNGINGAGQSYVVFGSSEGFPASLELNDLNGINGFALNGINTGDDSGDSVSGAGDINGDGFDDLIIGAPFASPNGTFSGQSYVVFGSDGDFPASVDLNDLDGSKGFVLNGINPEDLLGFSVSGAGDVNGDGFDDLIIGATGFPMGQSIGQSYVVFGSGSEFPDSIDLADLNGSNGFVLNGINPDDFSGRSVSGAGDVNGDGFDDLIVGVARAKERYVVFGSGGEFPSSIDLADLDGSNGFALNGINLDEFFSFSSVSGAGDINGDGFDDLIIGDDSADPNSIENAGQSYVVFGSDGGFPARLNLNNLDGSNGFVLNGINASDGSGSSVSGAGDVNGDGFDDLIIGAPSADANDNIRAGQSYVVFGSDGGFPDSLDLADLNGINGFALNGINPSDGSGRSVSGAGDVNGDGIDDLIVGANGADPNGDASGQSYVVFGVPDLEIGLYDTDTDTLITPIKNDDVIPASILPNGNVTIAAFVPENSRFFGDIESIFLDLNQGDVTRTENVEPYALFGDVPPGDFKAGSGIPLGDNSISFKLYSGDGLSGDFLGTVTRSFSIVEDLDIGLYDAESDELITPLNEGDELLASTLKDRNVTIAAFVPEDSLFFNQVESMGLNLNDGEVIRTENIEPYSLFGDINGNYNGGALPLGDNRIAFELYPDDNLQGGLLDTVTRNFTITNDL